MTEQLAQTDQAVDSAEPTDNSQEIQQPAQLSFSFAKRHKVILETNETPAKLYHTSETPFHVFRKRF